MSTKFRVYLVDNHDGVQANRKFGLTSITVTGTSQLPESSTYTLLVGVLAFGYATLRRRMYI